MSWSPQQAAAIKAVDRWLREPRATRKQVFRLFGYAGSGKTTLAKHLAEGVDGEVLYMCFTGKAALVLRKKGCYGASTIHSAIYKPVEDPVTGITEFKLNLDSPVSTAALIVVDEVSMVNEELARDLMSFGTPILVLGDPFQLPPVKGEGYFINAKPDVMLTEIHRQAAENPIIAMSIDVREGRGLKPGMYGTSLVMRREHVEKEAMAGMVLMADQVLCGLNKSRQTYNMRIRQLKGLAQPPAVWAPVAGDRLVCLRNDKTKGLLNGGLWNVEDVTAGRTRVGLRVRSLDEEYLPQVDVDVLPEFFQGTEKELDWKELKRSDHFTYGWALTCHKAQGSQWDNVMIFDEGRVFREDADKWLYTAVTRAAETVHVVL